MVTEVICMFLMFRVQHNFYSLKETDHYHKQDDMSLRHKEPL